MYSVYVVQKLVDVDSKSSSQISVASGKYYFSCFKYTRLSSTRICSFKYPDFILLLHTFDM